MESASHIKRPTRRSRSARSILFPCRETSMDDLKGFVPFFFRYLPETRPIQRSCRPNTILCQLMGHPRRRVQKTADARYDWRRRCRFQTRKKIIDVQPSHRAERKGTGSTSSRMRSLLCFADVCRQTGSFGRMRHHFGRDNVLHARVEGHFNLNFRVDIRYCTVQPELWVALVRPCNAQAANCHPLWPTLFGG